MLTTLIAGVLTFLLIIALSISYLIYIRMKDLQEELEQMRSRVEMHDDELEQIESSLSSVDL